jgi:hypothetical protein
LDHYRGIVVSTAETARFHGGFANRQSKTEDDGVIPVQDLLPSALAAVIRNAPLTPEKVSFAWRSAVGAAVANVTTAELRDGVLHVRARDAAWAREVERAAGLIRPRLDALLGAGVVRRLTIGG